MPPSGYSLSHGEDFSGSSLPSGWNLGYYFSNTVPSSAVTVSGGALHLTWTLGGVSDISVSTSATYHYGYFEVRMKWNPTTGAWPAFWMVPSGGIQHTGEIDVFEGQGDDAGAYFATLHEWNGSSQIWQSSPNRFGVSVDWTQYHDYGLLWEPGGKFTWYLDGAVIHQVTGAPSIFDTQSVFLILSMQEGANWSVGNLSGVSVSSLTLDVDSINVYTSSPAAPGSPVIASFSASPGSVAPGGTSTLSWSVTGATTLSIDQGVGTVTGSSTSVSPTTATTYTLTATNTNGTVTATATVSITASTGGSGSSGGTGSTGAGGGSTDTGTTTNTGGFTVGSIPPPVINSFTPSSGTITSGSSATLSFSTSGATANFIDGVPVTGSSLSVSPTTTTTFVLSAVNSGGTTTQEVTITVHGARAEPIRYHQIREGDREGDGHEFQMSAPANPAINGYPALYTTNENVIARQPRGNTTAVQLADQTGGYTEGDLVDFDRFGNTRDSGIKKSTVLTTIGGSGTTAGLTASGFGSWYGQVPRGAQNGSNTVFLLDYKLANPHAILRLNGVDQQPGIQGDPSSLTALMATPGGEFTISDHTLTVVNSPRAGERFFINYFRAEPLASVSTATIHTWSSFTSPDSTAYAFADASFHSGATATSVYRTNLLFALRHDTAALSTFPASVAGFTGTYVTFFLDGTVFANADNLINIYDCYLSLVLADASVQEIRPVSWAFTSGSDGSMGSWAAATGYTSGTIIIDSNGNLQMCTVAGTSGGAPPVWAVSGATVDGGVTWTYQGDGTTQTSTTGQIANPNLAYDADSVPPATFATFKRTHYSGLSTGGTFTLFF